MAASSSALVSVASLDLAGAPEITWPIDLMKKFDMTMHVAVQQLQLSTKHLNGRMAAVDGLLTSFRLLDELVYTRAEAAMAHPVTKVIIAPH